MQIARFHVSTTASSQRPLDSQSAAILDRLTADLADPAGHGLIAHEIGSANGGAPTVRAERLSADRYLVTRYIELESRNEDPELNDRVAAPEVELVRQGGDWFPVAVQRGRYGGSEQDPHELVVAMLRIVAREQSLEPSDRGWLGRLSSLIPRRKPRLHDFWRSDDGR